MASHARTEDISEGRIAHYLELAEAAQEAAGRAPSITLQETWADIAKQWLILAASARRTSDRARQAAPEALDDNQPVS